VKTHYELLDVSPHAHADQIKKAFRREIARYHPDKVQHLGPEFQEIAAVRAAELTEAYRVLMDDGLRSDYDGRLKNGAPSGAHTRPPSPAPPAAAPNEPRPPEPAAQSAAEPAPRTNVDRTPSDFVRKVGASRLRDAVTAVSGTAASVSVPGFDAVYDIKGKGGLFKKSEPPVRVLVKFVPQVDPDAVTASWIDAVRAARCQDHVCVLLLLGATGMASTKELSTAIAEHRRKARGVAPVVVPVDVRDWESLFPPDTPAPVRAIMQWLQQGTV
jgi:curved DNA-binding protein CbpA